MTFTLTIETGGAAFGDGDLPDTADELARILGDISRELVAEQLDGDAVIVRDVFGNTVGSFTYAEALG